MPDFNIPSFENPLFDAKPDQQENTPQTFAQAVQDVTPIAQDKLKTYNKTNLRKNKDKQYHREQAAQNITQVADGLSTEAVNIVESDQALLFAAPGVQLRVIKRLQKGHMPWEQGIDLHGFTIDEARNQLSQFIHASFHQGCQIVLIVHGKSYSQSGSLPLLKSYANDWLRQLPQVLAFSSAQAKDGGAGALYVLLRRKK
ncbi:MAG: DNA-nicking Smr family endonuclease [Oceanospirillaceae bacterium]|jgi:DNA-nicking Smr family endonuclease